MGHSGDTPVILIGGSVVIKHGSKDTNQRWTPKHSGEYHTTLAHPIASIALKKHALPDHDDQHRADDLDSDTDLERIDIPSGASWKVDIYEQNSGKHSAISLASTDLGILLTLENQGGSFCEHTQRRIAYCIDLGRTESGLKNAKIAKAVVSVDGKVVRTLHPIDLKSNAPGICRVVFRYPSDS